MFGPQSQPVHPGNNKCQIESCWCEWPFKVAWTPPYIWDNGAWLVLLAPRMFSVLKGRKQTNMIDYHCKDYTRMTSIPGMMLTLDLQQSPYPPPKPPPRLQRPRASSWLLYWRRRRRPWCRRRRWLPPGSASGTRWGCPPCRRPWGRRECT